MVWKRHNRSLTLTLTTTIARVIGGRICQVSQEVLPFALAPLLGGAVPGAVAEVAQIGLRVVGRVDGFAQRLDRFPLLPPDRSFSSVSVNAWTAVALPDV